MNSVIIDNKEYVLLKKREYADLVEKAARKSSVARKLSLTEGKKLALSLVDKWHKEK